MIFEVNVWEGTLSKHRLFSSRIYEEGFLHLMFGCVTRPWLVILFYNLHESILCIEFTLSSCDRVVYHNHAFELFIWSTYH